MKKVLIISKVIGEKKMFLFKIKAAHYWSFEITTASKFFSRFEAEEILQKMPDDTVGKCFMIETLYIKN